MSGEPAPREPKPASRRASRARSFREVLLSGHKDAGIEVPFDPADAGAPRNGCANSIDPNGANLGSVGKSWIANDWFVLLASGMSNRTALYSVGTAPTGAWSGTPFGDGRRCFGGSAVRIGTKPNSGGASHIRAGRSAALVGDHPAVDWSGALLSGLVPQRGRVLHDVELQRDERPRGPVGLAQ